jgi:hypothetical protein
MVAGFGMTERCPSNKTTAVRIKARINGVLITNTENQTREYNKEQEDEVTTGSRKGKATQCIDSIHSGKTRDKPHKGRE